MPVVTINYLAVVAVAVEAMALGMLWYGPLLGKQWMKLMGINPNDKHTLEQMKKRSVPAMASSTIGSLVLGYVLAHFVDYTMAKTLQDGLLAGFWLWLGFMAPVVLNNVMYGQKKFNLWFIDSGYYFVLMLVGAVTVTLWV